LRFSGENNLPQWRQGRVNTSPDGESDIIDIVSNPLGTAADRQAVVLFCGFFSVVCSDKKLKNIPSKTWSENLPYLFVVSSPSCCERR
jgi:hypothetical protein